jgi:hypothetical protein
MNLFYPQPGENSRLPLLIGAIRLITLMITEGNRKYFGVSFLRGVRQESAIGGRY